MCKNFCILVVHGTTRGLGRYLAVRQMHHQLSTSLRLLHQMRPKIRLLHYASHTSTTRFSQKYSFEVPQFNWHTNK